MLDEQQNSERRIMSIEAVAVRVEFEDPKPAHPSPIVDCSLSEKRASVLDTRHADIANSDEEGAQAIETEQSRLPMTHVWTPEVKAPTPEEALRSLLPRENGRLRVGIVGGILIGATAIAWWAGVLDAPHLVNSGPAFLQQVALPESPPIEIDKQTTPKPTDPQMPSTGGSEPGSKASGEPSAHTDEKDVARADPVESQKTPLTKPALAHVRENKSVTRPAPMPETKPKTIEGWTARAVTGRTAVLQGPTGVWNVAVGNTVPGAGRVESIVRWGNRWIVATSRGLITTD